VGAHHISSSGQQVLCDEETWGLLAALTSLQELWLRGGASGDPSPLSALTGLTYLKLQSLPPMHADAPVPFSFSSLQPLSTLQQLEELHLGDQSCAATSLQGLAGLSKLLRLTIAGEDVDDGVSLRLRSLEGISPRVQELRIQDAPDLVNLAGIVGCTSMERLWLDTSNLPSLQPLRSLSILKQLRVSGSAITSLEGINSMSLQSLTLIGCSSLTQLSGVGHLSALKSLVVEQCGVTSLQPLSQLGEGLQELRVSWCRAVQEEVLEVPLVQPTALVVVNASNVREVVLAGGVRKVCRP
jgi:Leucine-rich repeat (LRR) protein